MIMLPVVTFFTSQNGFTDVQLTKLYGYNAYTPSSLQINWCAVVN